ERASFPTRSPRTWHGMTVSIWHRMLWRHGFRISPSRWPMAIVIGIFSFFNSQLRLISELIYGRRAEQVQIQHPPVFILGHWRTGTTLLHELMVLDEQFSFPTTYECMAPHHFLLTGSTIPKWFNWLLPESRPMDNMAIGFERPQEDEFALMNL